MKKSIVALTLISTCFLATAVSANSIYIDEREIGGIETVNQNGRIMAPLKSFLGEFGIWPDWDKTTKTITINSEGIEIIMQKDNKIATVNGEQVELDEPATIIDGYTYVPVRFLGETLGMKVEWKKVNGKNGVYFTTTSDTISEETGPVTNPEEVEIYEKLEQLSNQGIFLSIKDGEYSFTDETGMKINNEEYNSLIEKLKQIQEEQKIENPEEEVE